MKKILPLIVLSCWCVMATAQSFQPIDTALTYEKENAEDWEKQIEAGKFKSAFDRYQTFILQAIATNNHRTLYLHFLADNFQLNALNEIENEDIQNWMHQLHHKARLCDNPITQSIIYAGLRQQVESYFAGRWLTYDQASLNWELTEVTKLFDNNAKPLLDFYSQQIQRNRFYLTAVLLSVLGEEGWDGSLTLAERILRFDKEYHPKSQDLFLASSADLSRSSDTSWRWLGEIELFHLSQKNGSGYLFWTRYRVDAVLYHLEFQQKINLLEGFQNVMNGLPECAYYHYLEAVQRSEYAQNPDAPQFPYSAERKKALRLVNETMKMYPDNPFHQELNELKRQIEARELHVEFPIEPKIQQKTLLRVHYKNIERVYLNVYHFETWVEDSQSRGYFDFNPLAKNIVREIWEKELKLTDSALYLMHSHDLLEKIWKKEGTYLLIASHQPDAYSRLLNADKIDEVEEVFWKMITISDLSAVAVGGNTRKQLIVSSNWDMSPKTNARIYQVDKNLRNYLGNTEKDGTWEGTLTNYQLLRIVQGSDSLDFSYYPQRGGYLQKTQDFVYTDRTIYRPGQTVQMKSISQTFSRYQMQLAVLKEVKWEVKDPNGKVVFESNKSTNGLGSTFLFFQLTAEATTGTYHVYINQSHCATFEVEEYKRPSFEITWRTSLADVQLNQSIPLAGEIKAFAGYPMENIPVTITIVERRYFPFYYRFSQQPEKTSVISTRTDENGHFETIFQPESKENYIGVYYEIVALATSANGESQTARLQKFVGEGSLDLQVDVSKWVVKNQGERIGFSVSQNGSPIIKPQILRYKIYKAIDENLLINQLGVAQFKSFKRRKFEKNFPFWEYGGLILSTAEIITGNISSRHYLSLDSLRLPQGRYTLQLEWMNNHDLSPIDPVSFAVIDVDSKRSIKEPFWSVSTNSTPVIGENTRVILGSGVRKPSVLLIKRSFDQWEVKRFRLKGRKSFATKADSTMLLGVHFTFMTQINGQHFQLEQELQAQPDSTELHWKWKTITDLTEPGKKEKWAFSIVDQTGKSHKGEALLNMYDKSLDQLGGKNQWVLPSGTIPKQLSSLQLLNAQQQHRLHNGYYQGNIFPGTFEWGKSHLGASGNGASFRVHAMEDLSEVAMFSKREKSPEATSNPRKNFSENVFFLPQMTVDSKENQWEFTMPDNLTSYQFQGLFQDRNNHFLLEERTLVARRDLMITPFEPRFFRSGDTLVWKYSIQNLSDFPRACTVQVNLYFPTSDRKIEFPKQYQQLKAASSTTGEIVWVVPSDEEMVQYQWSVTDGNQSDILLQKAPIFSKEQNFSSSELVVVDPSQSQKINDIILKISPKGMLPHKAVVRISSDIQHRLLEDLCELLERENELNESYLHQWLAAHRLLLAAVEDSQWSEYWQELSERLSNQLAADTFYNDRVRSAAPWITQRENQAKRVHQLQLLSNTMRIESIAQEALQMLLRNQKENGAWSWVGSHYDNEAITLYIAERLAQEKALPQDLKRALEKAVRFLNQREEDRFQRMSAEAKRNEKLSLNQMRLLFIWSKVGFESEILGKVWGGKVREQWTKIPAEYWWMVGTWSMKNDPILANKVEVALRDIGIEKSDRAYWKFSNRALGVGQSNVLQHVQTVRWMVMKNPNWNAQPYIQWLWVEKLNSEWRDMEASALTLIDLKENGQKGKSKTLVERNSEEHIVEAEEWMVLNADDIKNNRLPFILNGNDHPIWVEVKAEYRGDVRKTEAATNKQWTVRRTYFRKKDNHWVPLQPNDTMEIGDEIKVRVQLNTQSTMSYLYLEEPKPANVEMLGAKTGYQYNGTMYYLAPKDAFVEIYLEQLSKGIHDLEWKYVVSQAGRFATPPVEGASFYNPLTRSRSEGGSWKAVD